MKTPIFVSFCLLIVGMLVSLHVFFSDSLGPGDRLRREIAILKKARGNAEFRAQLMAHELADFQQHVATLLPEAIKSRAEPGAYALRQLASIAAGPSESIKIERASGLFEEAKAG